MKINRLISFGIGILTAILLSAVAHAQNVGIGTASPASKLSVNGNLSVGDTTFTGTAAPTDGAIIRGRVGIDTTSPISELHVAGVATVTGGTFPSTVNAFSISWNTAGLKPGQGCAEFVNYSGTGGGNAYDFYRIPQAVAAPTSAHLIASITPAGAYVQVSDKRAKSDIKPLSYGLKEIMALEPKEYDFHAPESIQKGEVKLSPAKVHQIGLLAQDVSEIVPEAVEKPQDPAKELYTMSYTSLVPVLVNAVKELKHQQNRKDAKIAALEAESAKLKAGSYELAGLRAENAKLAARMEALEKAMVRSNTSRNAVRTVSLTQE